MIFRRAIRRPTSIARHPISYSKHIPEKGKRNKRRKWTGKGTISRGSLTSPSSSSALLGLHRWWKRDHGFARMPEPSLWPSRPRNQGYPLRSEMFPLAKVADIASEVFDLAFLGSAQQNDEGFNCILFGVLCLTPGVLSPTDGPLSDSPIHSSGRWRQGVDKEIEKKKRKTKKKTSNRLVCLYSILD